MILKYLGKEYQREWEDLTKNNPVTGFMQSFYWAEFQNLIGWETYKIGIFDKNKLIGGAIIGKYSHYKDYNFLFIPEGPVIPYQTTEGEKMFQLLVGEIDKIINLEGKQRTSHLSIEPKLIKVPNYFSRFIKTSVDRQPLKTSLLDLYQTEEQILKKMKPKGRYNIKVAVRHKVKIFSKDPTEGLKLFLPLYKSFVKKHKIEGKDNDYFESLAYVLSKNISGKFYFACCQDQILATVLVVFYGNTATYLFGASTDINKKVMAPYLLHWEIIKELKRLGYKWYDWYGVSPDEKDENHPWLGFTKFKKKFGGQEVKYIGGYDFVYNDKLYQKYLWEK